MDPAHADAPPRRSLLPFIVGLAAFMLSMLLATTFPLLDPDEGRNAEVAREMAADGGWLVPHLAGLPDFEPPPAFAWPAAAVIRVAGNEPWAARLPVALAATLTLALLTRAAQRRAGRPFALRAAALLFTAPLFAALSVRVVTGMPLTLCVTAVWLGLAAEVTEGVRATRRLWMYAVVAAGVLVAGPVMIAWAIAGSLGAALLSRSRGPLRWLAWWPGWLVVFGTVVGVWFAVHGAQNLEPAGDLLTGPLERLARGSLVPGQPWWLAPVALVAGALPWSLATPWWRRRTAGEESLLSAESRVGLGFALSAVVLLALPGSRSATELLPALPMLAWTAAEAWSDAARVHRAAWGLALVFLIATLVSALAGFGPWLGRAGFPFDTAGTSAKILAACFAFVALRSATAALGRPERAFIGVLLFTPVLLLVANEPLLRYAGSRSGEPLARAITAVAPGGLVRYESCYSPGTDFRLGRPSALISWCGRDSVLDRDLWGPLAAARNWDRAEVIVHPVRGGPAPPANYMEFYRDDRFVAYVRR